MEQKLEVGSVLATVLAGVGPVEGACTGCKIADPPEELGSEGAAGAAEAGVL